MTGDATDEERRDGPGRRQTDEEVELIARAVREEVRRLRWRWLIVWIVTLVFSSFSWHQASVATEDVHDQAKQADLTAQKVQAEAKRSCLRVLVVAPDIVRDYEVRKVLTGRKLAVYKGLIPKHC